MLNPIVRAKDGIEALALLRGENGNAISKPFIILLDLNMPRMNGQEFLVNMRADEALSNTIVFVLTTSQQEEEKAAAYQQHIAGYIHKTGLENSFQEMVLLLKQYWRVVELPGD